MVLGDGLRQVGSLFFILFDTLFEHDIKLLTLKLITTMTKQQFEIGNKVMFKGEQHEVVKATYTYFPDGAWWVYKLENGAKAAAKDLTLATIPPKGDDVDSGAKNREKRGKFGK